MKKEEQNLNESNNNNKNKENNENKENNNNNVENKTEKKSKIQSLRLKLDDKTLLYSKNGMKNILKKLHQ